MVDESSLSPAQRTRGLAALATREDVTRLDVDGVTWLMPAGEAWEEPNEARVRFLAPFDPVVWDRARALDLFGFDYRIECYTPAAKRQYGYFTLPILHQNGLIGRLDAKAHRQTKLFEVRALHLEPEVALDDELLDALTAAQSRRADIILIYDR